MSSKEKITDLKVAKKELEKGMIKGILEYVKNGIFPNNNPNSYMSAYEMVYNMSNFGEQQNDALFEFYIITIRKFIEHCYKTVSKESTTQLIDSFIKHTDNINFLIYWMYRIFYYLDIII